MPSNELEPSFIEVQRRIGRREYEQNLPIQEQYKLRKQNLQRVIYERFRPSPPPIPEEVIDDEMPLE